MGITLHDTNPIGAARTATASTLPDAAPSASAPAKSSGKFGRLLGGLVGGALNIVVPGAGTAVGGIINQVAGGGPDFAQIEGMVAQTAIQQMQMLNIQTRVQTQTQEFTTITNLLKARHDGEMAAVHNMKG